MPIHRSLIHLSIDPLSITCTIHRSFPDPSLGQYNNIHYYVYCAYQFEIYHIKSIYLCVKLSVHFRIVQSIESLDEIHSCLLCILMWNYQSKVNYLCVKLKVHFRVFRK